MSLMAESGMNDVTEASLRRHTTSCFQKTSTDRRDAAEKIKTEASQLKRFFHKVAGDMADFDSPFDALALIAEVLGSDEEMLFLDIGTLVKRSPDVTSEQV